MQVIFGVLLFISFIMMIVSLINPKWGTFKKRTWSRKKTIGTWFLVGIICFIGVGVTNPSPEQQAQQKALQAQQKAQQEAQKHIFGRYYGFSAEQSQAIEDALASVGIDKINDATKQGDHNYTLDVHATDGYNPDKDTIRIFLDDNNKLQTIKYRAIDLWQNGQAVHQISDYVMNSDEEAAAMIMSKEMVKKILKAPSTAKFDESTFKYYKSQGVITVIGSVDAQNGFGAMLRSPWKTQFEGKGRDLKPTHMVFNAQQLF
ncbi:hypothetical protein [Acidaminococcus sp.]|uniref:hypothetical protein n=1 Tax=Acidaminococcus sp. TaxID=1872103 RepID=UPI003D7CF6FC